MIVDWQATLRLGKVVFSFYTGQSDFSLTYSFRILIPSVAGTYNRRG